MSSIEIKDAWIATQNDSREILKGSILLEGNRIAAVGEVKESADIVIDASSMLALPGFINTHCHVAMSHLKGLLDDITLHDFLEKTFSLDGKRTDEGILASSLLGMNEMISSGITSFHDLYYSEDVIARAAEKSGIRAFLSWNTLDKEYTTQIGDPVKNAESFISSFEMKERIVPSIGVQGIYVASDETYLRAKEVADRHNCTLHTHLSETRKEVYEYADKHSGERPAEHLSSIGFLSDRVIAAHTSFVTMREVRKIAQSGARVSWNAISNCKLGNGGFPPIPEMLENGIVVSLGTDSNGSNNSLNMFEEMKFSSLLMKNSRWDPSIINAQKLLDMATRDAALSLHMADLGQIQPNYLADIILLDLKGANMLPERKDTLVGNTVYSANPSNVDTVIVNGEILKRDGKILRPVDFEYDSMV